MAIMLSSYILSILCTATSVSHALYLQSSSSSLAYYSSSLQKKHHLRYATHHHPSTSTSSILAFSTSTHTRPHRIPNKRCTALLNNVISSSSEQQQIDNDNENKEHLVGIGVGIDLGTTNSAIAMMIPSTTDIEDIDDSDDVSRYVHIIVVFLLLSLFISKPISHKMFTSYVTLFILFIYHIYILAEEQYPQCYQSMKMAVKLYQVLFHLSHHLIMTNKLLRMSYHCHPGQHPQQNNLQTIYNGPLKQYIPVNKQYNMKINIQNQHIVM